MCMRTSPLVEQVVGVKEQVVTNSEELRKFFDECMENRSTSSTKLNDRSSRSHAIFTISIHRTVVDVSREPLWRVTGRLACATSSAQCIVDVSDVSPMNSGETLRCRW